MLEWSWYNRPYTKIVFLHLLLECEFQSTQWKKIEIPQGAVLTSLNDIAKKNGITKQNVRTALATLESTQEITQRSTQKYSLIYINKWKSYQQELTHKTHTDQHTDQHSANTVTSSPKNTKEVKNIYEGEAREWLDLFNKVRGTRYKSLSFFSNFCSWRKTYSLEEMKIAVTKIANDSFINMAANPSFFFRTKTTSGQDCDYIGRLLNTKSPTEREAESLGPVL